MEEKSSFASRRYNEPDMKQKEWSLRLRSENTNSRRFSASNMKSLREDDKALFRSNIAISSTASSPGYTIRGEIDPSTYSFTTALKALQAKTMYRWEYLSADGLRLNSKWNDAEKYICNPVSGEVPLECLSAKALSARIRIYPCHMHQFQAKSFPVIQLEENDKKRITSRDVGIQSTPSIEERSVKHSDTETEDSKGKQKSEAEVQVKEIRERKSTKGGKERMKAAICICGLSFKTKKKQK